MVVSVWLTGSRSCCSELRRCKEDSGDGGLDLRWSCSCCSESTLERRQCDGGPDLRRGVGAPPAPATVSSSGNELWRYNELPVTTRHLSAVMAEQEDANTQSRNKKRNTQKKNTKNHHKRNTFKETTKKKTRRIKLDF